LYLVLDNDHYRYDEDLFEHVHFLDRFVVHLNPIQHEVQMVYIHQYILNLFLDIIEIIMRKISMSFLNIPCKGSSGFFASFTMKNKRSKIEEYTKWVIICNEMNERWAWYIRVNINDSSSFSTVISFSFSNHFHDYPGHWLTIYEVKHTSSDSLLLLLLLTFLSLSYLFIVGYLYAYRSHSS